MQTHTLDKAGIINELKFGTSIGQAVEQGRRADFAMLLSMFSGDVRANTPTEAVPAQSDNELSQQLYVPKAQPLRSNEETYSRSANQAHQFHNAGMRSAKLAHYLQPDALAYMPENTCDLPEEIYHNLSAHERTMLSSEESPSLPTCDLYAKMQSASRVQQMSFSV